MKYNLAPVAQNSPYDGSYTHQTTIDFNQVVPLFSNEVLIGDDLTADVRGVIRLSPLNFPTYGNFRLKLVTMFVPYYQVFKDFDAWYSGISEDSEGHIVAPFIPRVWFLNFLTSDPFGEHLVATPSNPVSKELIDFQYFTTDGTQMFWHFNNFGRYVYKIFQMLGYCVETNASLSPTSAYATGRPYNGLPLLAFFKGFNDYMSLPTNYNYNVIHRVLATLYNGGSLSQLDVDDLIQAFQMVRPLMGSDYFTSAFNDFNNPGNTVPSVTGVGNLDSTLRDYFRIPNDVSTDNQAQYLDTSNGDISAYQLRFLRSLDAFVRRNNLAGSRAAQRIFSRFGIKSEDFRSNYAHVINITRSNFNVGDIMSTTPNENPALGLGTYGGQSIAQVEHKFNFKSADFGHLITYAFIEVDASYMNTISPTCLRSEYLDFYQPEFDGVGLQPVPYSQLTNEPGIDVVGAPYSGNKIFGFVPRYEDYRTNINKITGDFVHLSSLWPWHFGRDFRSFYKDGIGLSIKPQSNNFQFVGNEFDRIFVTDTDSTPDGDIYDHFFCAFAIQLNGRRRMKSRAGSIDFKDGQLAIEALGKNVQSV